MIIVDAHHHLWQYRAAAFPWLAAREALEPLRRDFTGDELAAHLAASAVDRTVIVQAADSLEESAFMLEAARRHAFIAGIVAWAPLDDPAATETVLGRYAREPAIKGIRHLLIFDADPDWTVRPNVVASLRLAADRGLCWDSNAGTPRHLEHVITLAETIPNLRQVIDHLGKPAATEGRWEPWATLMQRASEHPNVYVKLSGLTNILNLANATREQFQPYVEHVLQHFGPERVMIASNWPVSNLGADYDATWRATLEMIAALDPAARAQVLGGTATRFYNLAT